jgi:hypothetical protein
MGVLAKAYRPGCVASVRRPAGAGRTDHRLHHYPEQLAADIKARVCELRLTHPCWVPAGWCINFCQQLPLLR